MGRGCLPTHSLLRNMTASAQIASVAGSLLIFDLDGTLVDTVPDLADALNEVLQERDLPPFSPAEIKPMVGDGIPALVARGLAARGADQRDAAALARFMAIYEANAARRSRTYPGVRDTLETLRALGFATAVCTNKAQRATHAVLQGLGLLGLFDAVAGGDRYPVRKPDPGHLFRLIEEVGSDVAASAVIGDSENDAAAAHAARLPLVLMRYGYARTDPDRLGAAAVLDRFAELPAALARLGLTPSAPDEPGRS